MDIHVNCNWCGVNHTVKVRNKQDLINWRQGQFIQDAMPYLSENDRELLISQTCVECWKKLFPEI